MSESQVRHISTSTVTPQRTLSHPPPPKSCELTPWDLYMLSVQYIQKGLLFHTPPPQKQASIHHLKQSLSQALAHFFPLAGRFKTHHSSPPPSLQVFIDCNDAGAEFIQAAADVTVSDILNSIDVPQIVKSFFPLNGAINYDGHSVPLLAAQVTELVDGVFIGLSMNHSVVDGTSFWHFFNVWSEIARRGEGKGEGSDCISNPPVIERWFGDLDPSLVRLPFSRADEFIERFETPVLRERIFHFSQESLARLKAKAKQECNSSNISSFQALCAHVWRSVTRAQKLPPDQTSTCRLIIGNRSRLKPPLSPHYFGNCVQVAATTSTASQLLSHDLGWAASLVHKSVATHTHDIVLGALDSWMKAPAVLHASNLVGCSVVVTSSPRFDMYENDFGWGRPVAARCGCANKFDGKVTSYPGREGGGSVDLEISLLPEFMNALELDDEFMDVVSHPVVV